MRTRIDALVVKVAELCNLNCSYCYMYQHADKSYTRRPRFLSPEVFQQTLVRASDYCRAHPDGGGMSLILHGGEPLLIGGDRLEWLAQTARSVLGENLRDIGMQTKATLIDYRNLEIIRRYRIIVGVRIDWPEQVHNKAPVDHS